MLPCGPDGYLGTRKAYCVIKRHRNQTPKRDMGVSTVMVRMGHRDYNCMGTTVTRFEGRRCLQALIRQTALLASTSLGLY